MKDFNNFCDAYNYKSLKSNAGAEEVYMYLCSYYQISKLIIASEMEFPAVSFVAKELEIMDGCFKNFSVSNDFNRQVIGKMISFILSWFGYEPVRRAAIDRHFETELFDSGRVYEWNSGNPQECSLMYDVIAA